MVVHTIATVTYACDVDGEDAEKIMNYAAENNCAPEVAAFLLYTQHELPNLYDNATEEDFSTEDVDAVEFEGDEEEYYDKLCGDEDEEDED